MGQLKISSFDSNVKAQIFLNKFQKVVDFSILMCYNMCNINEKERGNNYELSDS